MHLGNTIVLAGGVFAVVVFVSHVHLTSSSKLWTTERSDRDSTRDRLCAEATPFPAARDGPHRMAGGRRSGRM
jgi:hypothetical protein